MARTSKKSDPDHAKQKLIADVEEFVDAHLDAPVSSSSFKEVRSKVINDGVWRTVRLKEFEVAIMDTPLAQRLRYIHQTGFAHYTYPSMNHSRFEHTLGVILNIERLGTAIEGHEKRAHGENKRLSHEDINAMRIAALCHDFGHGIFSHTSEAMYGYLPEMQSLVADFSESGSKPHELLSYLIITSGPFRKYFDSIRGELGTKFDLDKIAAAIIGDYSAFKGNSEVFVAELVNGPFDADKLDYLFRDGHFGGIPLSIDTERLWHTVRIGRLKQRASGGDPGKSKEDYRLMVSINGANCLEQIIQAKMALFASIYQHHKIRAYDCMAFGIFEYMRREGISIPVRGKNLTWNSAVDYLWLCDDDLRNFAFSRKRDDKLHNIIHNLYYRRPLKRALVISKKTIKSKSGGIKAEFNKLNHDSFESYKEKRKLAEKILKRAKVDCDPAEIWVDLPSIPKAAVAAKTYVLTNDNRDDEYTTLEDLFPMSQWMTQYSDHKWRGHIFAPPEHLVAIGKAAYEVIRDQYGIELTEEAFSWCRQKHPYPGDAKRKKS